MSTNTQYLCDKKYTYKYFSRRNLCRLCWKISKGGISLENDLLLAQFIIENIGICVKGHILQTICSLCTDKLYSFINFKKFCLEADQKLSNILTAGHIKKKLKVDDEDLSIEPLTCKVIVSKIKSEPSEKQEKISDIKSGSNKNEPDNLLSSPLCIEDKKQQTKTDSKPKRKRYRCQICAEIFSTFRAYNQHRHKNHPDQNKFVCETCGRVLHTKQALSNHVLTHTDQKVKCPQCDQCFKVRDNLKAHIRRVHLRERRFACHMCPLRCFNNHLLQIHLKTHFGIKSFQCQICPKKYAEKRSLQKHIKLLHEGLVGQYKCTFCSSKYNDMRDLRKHMLKVHGKKIKACKGSFTVVDLSINEKSESNIEKNKDRMTEPNGGDDTIAESGIQDNEQLFSSVLQHL